MLKICKQPETKPGPVTAGKLPHPKHPACARTQFGLDYAFAAGNDTGAVLIIKNGAIVAEQYASDRDATNL